MGPGRETLNFRMQFCASGEAKLLYSLLGTEFRPEHLVAKNVFDSVKCFSSFHMAELLLKLTVNAMRNFIVS